MDTLGDVTPRLAAPDSTNGPVVHPKLYGKTSRGHVGSIGNRLDPYCLLGGEACPGMLSPTDRATPFLNHIGGIVGSGPEKVVVGPNTGGIITTVTKIKPIGNRPVSQLPSKAMGQNSTPLILKARIAVRLGTAGTCPAIARLVHGSPEACGGATIGRHWLNLLDRFGECHTPGRLQRRRGFCLPYCSTENRGCANG